MIKIKKYNFIKKKQFLKYIINQEEIRIDSEKIEKIINIELIKNLKELKFKLRFFLFYQQYIKGFLNIIKPIYELM